MDKAIIGKRPNTRFQLDADVRSRFEIVLTPPCAWIA